MKVMVLVMMMMGGGGHRKTSPVPSAVGWDFTACRPSLTFVREYTCICIYIRKLQTTGYIGTRYPITLSVPTRVVPTNM